MRIGASVPADGFVSELSDLNARIQERFARGMGRCIMQAPVKVMLGDATVTEQLTFDPAMVRGYFEGVVGGLDGWDVQDTSVTNNEDVRRIFAKFSVRAGSYLLSGHISTQFHVLLYYKTDHRVVEVQRELSALVDATRDRESQLAEAGDKLVVDRLKDLGYADLDSRGLFEVFFKDDGLREGIYSEIRGSAGGDLRGAQEKKQALLDELDGLLVETYQTSAVAIDDARLVAGEEGYLCTFDLEFVKNGAREGLFDARKVPDRVAREILGRLAEFGEAVGEGGEGAGSEAAGAAAR